MKKRFPYQRVLLKLSGESLSGEGAAGLDLKKAELLARQIQEVRDLKVQVALVIGAGNFIRGRNLIQEGMAQVPADQMGMLATLLNALALQEIFQRLQCPCSVFSALSCEGIVPKYSWKSALEALENHQVVIFAGGTGSVFFTTDSAAALRAAEMNAEILLKGTKVNGVYAEDPRKNSAALRFEKISYQTVLSENLQVMDATAIAICRERAIPIRVFDLFEEGALKKVVFREPLGTLVSEEEG